MYVGGFSKNLATGLRLGYLIAPPLDADEALAYRLHEWPKVQRTLRSSYPTCARA